MYLRKHLVLLYKHLVTMCNYVITDVDFVLGNGKFLGSHLDSIKMFNFSFFISNGWTISNTY